MWCVFVLRSACDVSVCVTLCGLLCDRLMIDTCDYACVTTMSETTVTWRGVWLMFVCNVCNWLIGDATMACGVCGVWLCDYCCALLDVLCAMRAWCDCVRMWMTEVFCCCDYVCVWLIVCAIGGLCACDWDGVRGDCCDWLFVIMCPWCMSFSAFACVMSVVWLWRGFDFRRCLTFIFVCFDQTSPKLCQQAGR